MAPHSPRASGIGTVARLPVVNFQELRGGKGSRVEVLVGRPVSGREGFGGGFEVQTHDGKALRAACLVTLRAAVEDQNLSAAATCTAWHGRAVGRTASGPNINSIPRPAPQPDTAPRAV